MRHGLATLSAWRERQKLHKESVLFLQTNGIYNAHMNVFINAFLPVFAAHVS